LTFSAYSEPPRDALFEMTQCTKIGDPTERLHCFDTAAARAQQSLVPSAEGFGKPPAPTPQVERITATVRELLKTPRGQAIFVLDNGQTWLDQGAAHSVSSQLQTRDLLERLVATGRADASTYLALARACASAHDHAAALAAVDRALGLEPRNLLALIVKADQLTALGDERAASTFYRAAVSMAPSAREMPAATRDEVTRPASACEQYAQRFERHLREHLARGGYLDPGSRFHESLEILGGRKSVYFQEPRHYFFPGLPQLQFYPRKDFPWLERLEAATADIRGELLQILQQDSAFSPYIQRSDRRPHLDAAGLLENPAWSAFYLWKHGELVVENAARCPKTVRALEGVPFAFVKNRSPSVMFSLLKPGAHIPPHTGEVNTRLVCHLPLIVPENCHLRVGNETRQVVEGQGWLFDDTIEHEAWNRSNQTRVILLFEVWRPELTGEERAQVAAMFEAIDAYGGPASAFLS
jgi:aspartyl/asparaginyl beta-hydroxylase (cupin superfamily)